MEWQWEQQIQNLFKKTFHNNTIDDVESFLKMDLQNSNLKETISYNEENERNFVPKKLNKIIY